MNIQWIFGSQKQQKAVIFIAIAATAIFLGVVTWYSVRVSQTKGDALIKEGVEAQQPFLDISGSDPEQVSAIVERVSKHILMPSGEITVTTVTDADGLRRNNPAAFQYVKNGDKILWHAAGIIIYDAAVDRIVDIIRIVQSEETGRREPPRRLPEDQS